MEVTGWLWAVMSVMMVVGSFLAKQLVKKKMKYWKIMLVSVGCMAVPILLSSVAPIFWLAAGFFVIHEIGRGIDRPMRLAYVNKFLSADKRATLLSFDSMVGKLAAALGLIGFGWFAQATSFALSWTVAGLLLLLLVPLYLKVKQKEERVT